jgi:hypothetical protein
VSDRTDEQRPALRIITADATDEEIAAILAVFLARRGAAVDGEPAPASTWVDPVARCRSVGVGFQPGRDGWRTSSWPR